MFRWFAHGLQLRPFFCHEAFSVACCKAQLSCGHGSWLVIGTGPPPFVTHDSAVIAPCVDNGNVIGTTGRAIEILLQPLVQELEQLGLACHDLHHACERFTMPGFDFNLRIGILR